MLTKPPNVLCSKHGGPRVDLPRQFGRVWSSIKFNGFDVLLVVLGGSALGKLNYPEFVLGMNEAT